MELNVLEYDQEVRWLAFRLMFFVVDAWWEYMFAVNHGGKSACVHMWSQNECTDDPLTVCCNFFCRPRACLDDAITTSCFPRPWKPPRKWTSMWRLTLPLAAVVIPVTSVPLQGISGNGGGNGGGLCLSLWAAQVEETALVSRFLWKKPLGENWMATKEMRCYVRYVVVFDVFATDGSTAGNAEPGDWIGLRGLESFKKLCEHQMSQSCDLYIPGAPTVWTQGDNKVIKSIAATHNISTYQEAQLHSTCKKEGWNPIDNLCRSMSCSRIQAVLSTLGPEADKRHRSTT